MLKKITYLTTSFYGIWLFTSQQLCEHPGNPYTYRVYRLPINNINSLQQMDISCFGNRHMLFIFGNSMNKLFPKLRQTAYIMCFSETHRALIYTGENSLYSYCLSLGIVKRCFRQTCVPQTLCVYIIMALFLWLQHAHQKYCPEYKYSKRAFYGQLINVVLGGHMHLTWVKSLL